VGYNTVAVVAEVDVVVEGEGSDYNQSLRRRDDSLVEERDTIDRKQGKVDHYQTSAVGTAAVAENIETEEERNCNMDLGCSSLAREEAGSYFRCRTALLDCHTRAVEVVGCRTAEVVIAIAEQIDCQRKVIVDFDSDHIDLHIDRECHDGTHEIHT
jgi:hypothetical protein